MKAEDNALVLDYLPRGRSSDYKTEPLAQLLGTEFFTLLEVVPKARVELKPLEEVYVGKDERPKIDYIKKRISYKELTNNALNELESAIKKIVLMHEPRFVQFFNTSKPITLKRHQLELLPGMGKKHMLDVLSEREKKPFESFQDIKQRVHGLQDPAVCIVKRVMEELEGIDVKFYLFARPPFQEKPFFHKKRF